MNKVFLVTDYNKKFGSKWNSKPYRSGYDKNLLKSLFEKSNIELEIIEARNITFNKEFWNGKYVIYNSSEENGLHYKSYLEDVMLGLKLLGAKLLPHFELLRAHENKVFMEILRESIIPEELRTLKAQVFGTFEEVENAYLENKIELPCVIKKATGNLSRGVTLAKNKEELFKKAKSFTSTYNLKHFLKEYLRTKKHSGYKKESSYQNKIIIQPLIPDLKCDWKLLVYGDKIFILQRNIKEGDFRASGSGINYQAGSKSGFPTEYLDFAYKFFKSLDAPNLSMDFAFDGQKAYIFEFQGLYFGTSTQYKSKDYYTLKNGEWILEENTYNQEEIYVESIVNYISKQ